MFPGINKKKRLSTPEHKKTYLRNVTFQNNNNMESSLLVSFFKKSKIPKHPCGVKVI
jgi:hypothetical protein